MRSKLKRLAFTVSAIVAATATAPSTAAECGTLQIVTSLPMTPLGPGNVVTIPVTVEDRPMQFLVDTGGANAVTKRTVRELKLAPVKVNGRLIGVSGAYSDEMVRISSFIIGRLRQAGGYLAIEPGND